MWTSQCVFVLLMGLTVLGAYAALSQIEEPVIIPKDDYTVQRVVGSKIVATGGDLSSSREVDIVPILVTRPDGSFSLRLGIMYRGEDWIFLRSKDGLVLHFGKDVVLDGTKPLRLIHGYHQTSEQAEFAISKQDYQSLITTPDAAASLNVQKGTFNFRLDSNAIRILRDFFNQYGSSLRDNREIHYTGG
jgi:hypothetical protein